MSTEHDLDAGTRVIAVLDIGGLDRPFVPRGTTGGVESASSASTHVVQFEGVGSVDVDDDVEVKPVPSAPAAV